MGTNKEINKKSYFYVLYCKDRSLYAGYTTDLKRREKEHNSGEGAKYTRPKSRRPLKMIYAESYETRSQATKAEAAFKKLNRIKKEDYLKKNGISFPLAQFKECIVKERGEKNEEPKKL
ncbi:MAG: GIY-YIG nuclease family protein [Atopostipes suicloacalis]|nr:GIY-YIG nuclease family protein [Atopostipes suicloacalis]MDN6730781.1 GIY-YIG nuclease family protein [Atopostipes suicloacalis]